MTRRSDLADAAIETLAAAGMRGLTHRAVDRRALLPEGSTSYYFRTRQALLQAVVERLAELTTAEIPALPVTGLDAFGRESAPSSSFCDRTFAPGVGGIQGYWKLDERAGTSAIDSSGFDRNGAIVSATYSLADRPNIDGDRSALAFSSSPDSAVFVPPATGLDLASPSFTVSFWTKVPAAGSVTFLGSSAGDCIHPAWEIAQSASGLRVFDARGPHALGTSIPVGVWTHVAIVSSSASPDLSAYVNGALVGTVPGTQFGLAHDPFYIGHVAGCPGGAVMMDSVQVLSRALSAAEIAAIGAPPPAPRLSMP